MKRRTFIASVGTTTTLLLAGCNSKGNDTGPSSTASGETTTGTVKSTTSNGSTSSSSSAKDTTDETPTNSETTSSTETTTGSSGTTTSESKTVSFGEHAPIADGLSVAVTSADTSDSYDHSGTTEKADNDSTFLLVTFETKNSGESSQSLPDDASLTVHANGNEYSTTDSAMSAWKKYRSSDVKANHSSSITVAFEVPKDALASLGVTVMLTYTDSGSKQLIRWSME